MSRLSASEVINRGDYLQPDFEPSSLTIPHLLSVLTYHGIKYPSPHTKGKLIEVFNNELKPRGAQLLKERQIRDRKKPSHEGIFDGHTGQAIQSTEPAPLRRSTRRSSRQPSESEPPPEPIAISKRRRASAEPTTSRSTSSRLHQAPAEPVLEEESEQEEQAKPRKTRKGSTLRERRQSAGLSDANESVWEDNNVFQSGAESSSPAKPTRQPKSRAGPPPVTRRVSTRSSLSAPPQLQPPNTRPQTAESEALPEPIVEPSIEHLPQMDVPSSSTFIPRLPATVSIPAGGLKGFQTPMKQIRKSLQAAEASMTQDATDSDGEETEEEEEETQKPAPTVDQSRGPEIVESELVTVDAAEDSIISESSEEDKSYEQIDEPVDYDSAVAKRIASIGEDAGSGKALVRRTDVQPPPVLPSWLTSLMGLALAFLVSVTVGYKAESASIGWCDTGSNTNSIIPQLEAARVARYECAERLYLNSTLGAVGMIDSADGAANKQEVVDGIMGGECTPLPLLPIPRPSTCTPCPAHATCNPPYEMVCDPTYILKPHPLAVIPGLRQIATGLPGFGSVAFPPQCVEDDARKRKVSGVAKGIATYLETFKGERICSGVGITDKPIDGGDARKYGVRVQDLSQLVLKEIKRNTPNRDDYQDIFETALDDLEKYGWVERSTDSNRNQWVAAKRLSMGTVCRVKVGTRETWQEWQLHFYTLIASILSGFWARSKFAAKRRESRRIAELAGVALDLVRNQEIQHHTDPVRSPYPYVSSLHLRDMVLQEEHNVRERIRLWSQVAKIVEGNANIRANVEEVAGDETRVWRWVGTSRTA